MDEQYVPDKRPGPATETPSNAGDAKNQASKKSSPATPVDNDTEGQGGKVFAVDQPEPDAEPA